MRHRDRKGVITIVAMVFLALFAALAVEFCSATNNAVIKSANQRHVQNALMEAESGLSFCLYVLRNLSITGNPSGLALRDKLHAALADHAAVSGNNVAVAYDGATITLGNISCGDGGSFAASITVPEAAPTTVRVEITGTRGVVNRQVSMDLNLTAGSSPVLNYGIATKSAISLTGNDSIKGANNPGEASILSETYTHPTAVTMTGNAKIQGDVYVSNPGASVSLTGNVSIGGASGAGALNHVHTGVGTSEFPTVDQTVFEPFATTNITSSTSVTGNKTFTNIRIKAGANPNFSGNITIKGVVYIEKPNKVTFAGNLNLTGVIVTEDAGEDAYTDNYIKFNGNSAFQGVEALPDTPEFHTLRTMPGAAILAPGFGLSFTGNFGTVNGTMAADSYKFVGNAGGTVYGSVINYSDSNFSMTGNTNLIINRSKYANGVPGLSAPSKLAVDFTSYREF